MTAWENTTKFINTDWTETKQYFERLVLDFKIFEQNSSITMRKGTNESASQATEAAKGNKLRHCITTIAAAAVANIRETTQKKTDKMATQLKLLSDTMATLTKALANKENNGGGNIGGGGNGSSSTGGRSGKKP